MTRIVTILLGGACAASIFAQPSGAYLNQPWTVNENHTLIWNGKPYLPLGFRGRATPETISAMTSAGARDCLLELSPGNWESQLAPAISQKLTYLVTQSGPAPTSAGFEIRPEYYRVDGITSKGTIELQIPGAVSVYYFLATEQGTAVSKRGWAPISGGKISIQVERGFLSEKQRVFLFPKFAQSNHADYWERFDGARDQFLRTIQQTKFGEGFRGFVNPLGKVLKWTWPNGGFVPDSELFRIEFQSYLENRYHDIDALCRAWRLRSFDLRDFKTASLLVPLFADGRGIDSLWNPFSDALYAIEIRGCMYWNDLQAAIDLAAARRTARLASAIKSIVSVPVIYEWEGWSAAFDTRTPSGDGIGMGTVANNKFSLEPAAEAMSSALAWRNKGWMIATDIGAGASKFSDARSLQLAVQNCADLGAKGWFVNLDASPAGFLINSLANDTSLNPSLVEYACRAIFYPENARFPAETIQLPGGVWWLPSPAAGNRMDVGSAYESYRHSAVYGTFFALWRVTSPTKVKLKFVDASRVSIKNYDGTEPERKQTKDGVEIVIGTLPVIITGIEEQPVPEDALLEAQSTYKRLAEKAKSAGTDISDLRFMFEDSQRRLSSTPGPAFASMIESLRKMEKAVGSFTWVEAEKADETNFEFTDDSPACSASKFLAINTPFMHTENSFFASYSMRSKPANDEVDLWIAARIPEEMRQFVQIEMKNRPAMKLPGSPVSKYGNGFAWYNLGRLKLAPGNYRVTIRVTPGAPVYDVALDVILFAPPGFQPAGLKLPSSG